MDNIPNIYDNINNRDNMKVKKSIDVKQDVLDTLNTKYPNTSFTRLVEMGLEKLLEDNQTSTPDNQLQLLIQDYNKLKTSYRKFKDEVDNRLIVIETKIN